MSGQTGEANVTRIQELIFELDAGTAMAKNIITVEASTEMREVQALFKEKRITGMPVVDDGSLIGIISLEDFIKWLADGSRTSRVADRMTRDVKTVYEDEPLVNVAATLEKFGFGRLPVLERGTNRVVGIVTKADIIQTLLQALENDFQEEEIKQFQATRLFDKLLTEEMELKFKYVIQNTSIEKGGSVASSIKRTLKTLGIHPLVARRVSIATYEAEMNVIIYADSARVFMTIFPDSIEIDIDDTGPGIPDVEKAMAPGYSTAPDWVRELGFGAGMGLANIEACSQKLKIDSKVGRGTRLHARFSMEEQCA